MPAAKSPRSLALDLARRRGVVRAREFLALGVSALELNRLVAEGRLVRIGRGLYRLAQARPTRWHDLAVAAAAVPQGVVGLGTALAFHGLAAAPKDAPVSMTIGLHAATPSPSGVEVAIVRAGGEAFSSGIETHRIEGVPVRVYAPAKALAQAFKHRGKLGTGFVLAALREAVRRRAASVEELSEYAAIERVRGTMLPALETMLLMLASDAGAKARRGAGRKRGKRRR